VDEAPSRWTRRRTRSQERSTSAWWSGPPVSEQNTRSGTASHPRRIAPARLVPRRSRNIEARFGGRATKRPRPLFGVAHCSLFGVAHRSATHTRRIETRPRAKSTSSRFRPVPRPFAPRSRSDKWRIGAAKRGSCRATTWSRGRPPRVSTPRPAESQWPHDDRLDSSGHRAGRGAATNRALQHREAQHSAKDREDSRDPCRPLARGELRLDGGEQVVLSDLAQVPLTDRRRPAGGGRWLSGWRSRRTA